MVSCILYRIINIYRQHIIPIQDKNCLDFYLELELRARMARRNTKYFERQGGVTPLPLPIHRNCRKQFLWRIRIRGLGKSANEKSLRRGGRRLFREGDFTSPAKRRGPDNKRKPDASWGEACGPDRGISAKSVVIKKAESMPKKTPDGIFYNSVLFYCVNRKRQRRGEKKLCRKRAGSHERIRTIGRMRTGAHLY